ncbi:MAG TPA: hypothetical protein PKD61_11925 [Polyangiaceae bacterium]|nr:hypothetical protein [Polyangiaceae bacterium]
MKIFLCLIAVLLFSHRVNAQNHFDTQRPTPDHDQIEALDNRDVTQQDHFELSMGFLLGQRSYANTTFNPSDGTAALSLDEAFGAAPYDRVLALGLRYDARLVVSYVRMTAGFDLPFAAYDAATTRGQYDVDGQARDVSVRSLSIKGLRFGIGGEYPFKAVAPFVDLLGSMNLLDTTLQVDGQTHDYESTTFGFSVRGGIRLQVRRWFFASIAGEVGLNSDVLWGGELSGGFSTF